MNYTYRKTIRVVSPISHYIKNNAFTDIGFVAEAVFNYLAENPTPKEFLEDLRKYRKLLVSMRHQTRKIPQPFHKDIQIISGYKAARDSAYEDLILLIERLNKESNYAEEEIKNWGSSLYTDACAYLYSWIGYNIEGVISKKEKPDLELFLPPMIYAGIRKQLA